jgi:hypothetical protein
MVVGFTGVNMEKKKQNDVSGGGLGFGDKNI